MHAKTKITFSKILLIYDGEGILNLIELIVCGCGCVCIFQLSVNTERECERDLKPSTGN